MAVAKRQRRKKPAKIEQRKIPGPEWEPQVKHAALLASPVYRGQAQGEEAKMDWGSSFGLACPHASRMYFSFARQIKLSCNWAVTLVCCFKFSLWRDRTKELTHCPNKRIKNIYFTFKIIFLVYFNWRLITLQYCSCFCHTLTWICHECTCVPDSAPSRVCMEQAERNISKAMRIKQQYKPPPTPKLRPDEHTRADLKQHSRGFEN